MKANGVIERIKKFIRLIYFKITRLFRALSLNLQTYNLSEVPVLSDSFLRGIEPANVYRVLIRNFKAKVPKDFA